MQFPLPDADLTAFTFAVLALKVVDVGFEFVEVVHAVVGHTDGADAASLLGFNEGAPGAEAGFGATIGGVDEVSRYSSFFKDRPEQGSMGRRLQVYVIEFCLAEAGVYGRFRCFIAHCSGRDFGGEEDFATGDAGFADGFGAGAFIAVGAGGVDLLDHNT